ncbi:HK97-gp10 family putative phage morphogenesis protein [Shimia sediminis]|uniref:HK97-gp10 family putative phage morphogenesis protein n=1 Tax=Shimia sediminis TaxID=2497945 RepID=UPI0022A6E407|nr:HK97-gp10 family putative phage morphogenesis protein [Shimia sediminis]
MRDGGLKSFQKRMRTIPRKVRKDIEPALMKSATEMAEAMEALAPEDSGALKDSIEITGPERLTPSYSQPGGSKVVPSNAVAITVGNSEVRYPHLVEYGTIEAPAQPFFWPSYRLLKKRSANRIKRSMSKAIKEAGK